MRKPGRPAGASANPARILAAARDCFTESGYEGATIRRIAARAGCDPALVHYFFKTKSDLFTAALALPAQPPVLVADALAGGVSGVGERLVFALLSRLDDPSARGSLLGLVRSAITHEDAARMLREYLTTEALAPLAAALGVDNPALRASLAASQLMGLVVARYFVGLEPLASTDLATVAPMVGACVQHCLTAPLSGESE
ncbi:TetR family transcriptional regulator [Kutzneria sp. NPDC052558]|uniref:TetR/AcrR family transcriptional regulator n=1 Tax=Kutzneria sp. NPDC052558 TaxID=3364121 RepID=UPI0037CA1605